MGTFSAMAPTKKDILAALETVPYPGYSRNIVSFGLIREVTVAPEGTTIVVSSHVMD